MSGHTKEPWRYDETDFGTFEVFSRAPGRDGEIIFVARFDNTDDLDRLTDCVNALAGYNPAALAALVEAAEMALILRGNEDSLAELKDALLAIREPQHD